MLDTAPTEPNPPESIIDASHSIFSSKVKFEPKPAFVRGLFFKQNYFLPIRGSAFCFNQSK